MREAEVGIDDGCELDAGEVMALRHHLRAEQHDAVGAAEAVERSRQLGRLRCRVRVEPDPLEPGHEPRELRLEPLRPGADAHELRRAAHVAPFARRAGPAAVVAAQHVIPVQHERDVAVRAADGRAARAAVDGRGDSAPVEEDDRAAPALVDALQGGDELAGQRIAGLAPHVDDGDARQTRRQPFAEHEPLERRPALRPRRRAAVDRDRPFERRPLGGDGARVVTRIRLLLVRRVVLLVHAHDAEAAHRREHRRARADDDSRLARSDPLALVAPLRLRQPGVEHRHVVAEARAEAAQRLRRERDLRDEDDGVPAARHRRRARAEIDLGLAAARLTPEQEVATAGSQRLLHTPERSLLRRAQHNRRVLGGQRVRLRGRAPFAAPGTRAGGATSASARAGVEP